MTPNETREAPPALLSMKGPLRYKGKGRPGSTKRAKTILRVMLV